MGKKSIPAIAVAVVCIVVAMLTLLCLSESWRVREPEGMTKQDYIERIQGMIDTSQMESSSGYFPPDDTWYKYDSDTIGWRSNDGTWKVTISLIYGNPPINSYAVVFYKYAADGGFKDTIPWSYGQSSLNALLPYEAGALQFSIETRDATDITTTSAQLNGYLNDMEGMVIREVWFGYDTVSHAGGGAYAHYTSHQIMVSIGEFHETITNLDSNVKYYFRALGETPGGGETGGWEKSFTTTGAEMTKQNYIDLIEGEIDISQMVSDGEPPPPNAEWYKYDGTIKWGSTDGTWKVIIDLSLGNPPTNTYAIVFYNYNDGEYKDTIPWTVGQDSLDALPYESGVPSIGIIIEHWILPGALAGVGVLAALIVVFKYAGVIKW